MKLTLNLKAYGNSKSLYDCFYPETEKKRSSRASTTIKKNKDNIEFQITAKDSVALRAAFNSISKLLTVYEKMHNL